MTLIDWWPIDQLKPTDIGVHPAPRNVSGGVSTTGVEQLITSLSTLWMVDYQRIAIRNVDQAMIWAGMDARLEGRLNPVMVPFCLGRRPYIAGVFEEAGHIPHDDDTLFDDETGYYQPVINVTVGATAALRSSSIVLSINSGAVPTFGMFFQIGVRVYQIKSIISVVGAIVTVGIRPLLREEVLVGTQVNFDDPRCKMKLMTDEEMQIVFKLHRRASPSIRFIEDLT
jgi:hypothetical protein